MRIKPLNAGRKADRSSTVLRRFLLNFAATASIAAIAAAGQATLPSLSGLPELKIDLLTDFADHPETGLPWLGHLAGSDFVFYDAKLRQVFHARLAGGALRKIGGPGQGPGEYERVLDLLVEGETIFVLDGRGRIIAYGRDGKAVRELTPPLRPERILGREGDRYYLEGRDPKAGDFRERIVASWKEGAAPIVLVRSKADIMETKATDLSGQALSRGQFALSAPVFSLDGDRIVESSGNKYRLRFFDFAGDETGAWNVTAPEPEFSGSMFNIYNGKRPAYAVRAVFPVPSGLAVVGNFYRNGRPRLDCFDRQGRLRASYLLPLAWEPPFSRCQIEDGRLIYFSSQESCRIFRIISPL